VFTVIGATLLVEMFPEAVTSRAAFVIQAAVDDRLVAPVMYKPPPAVNAPVLENAPPPVKVMFPEVVVTGAF
jgi:hypothetical protein